MINPEIKLPLSFRKNIRIKLGPDKGICFVIDAGFETLSTTEISIEGRSGIIVDIGRSECIWHNKVPTMWQSPSLIQSERIILKDGLTHHITNQPRGFRYLVMRFFNPMPEECEIILNSIKFHEEIYPAEKKGIFRCSEKIFEEIYNLSARTVNLCMEDAYTDCPWRERSQWVGDAQPEALFNYYCFGAYELSRKAIDEFTSGNTEEGWIPGVFPGTYKRNLPTWGMRIPVIVWEYYLFTGDRETVEKAYPGVRKQIEWLLSHTEKNGLFDLKAGWNFVDWTALDDRNSDGAVCGWFLESLIYGEKIARTVKDKETAEKLSSITRKLKKSIARFYWSEEKKAFRKYRPDSPCRPYAADPDIIGQQENFLFVRLGIGTKRQRKLALDTIAGKTGLYLPNIGDYQSNFAQEGKGNFIGEEIIKIGSPFWSFYALLCLCKQEKIDKAIEYIRLMWGMMLEFGATSCWEMWDRHTSFCHGWSAAPAMILPAYIGGIRPLQPGFKKFEISPYLYNFQWIETKVPSPCGIIGVILERNKKGLDVAIEIPEGLTGIFVVPDGFSQSGKKIILKNGKHKLAIKKEEK